MINVHDAILEISGIILKLSKSAEAQVDICQKLRDRIEAIEKRVSLIEFGRQVEEAEREEARQ